MDVEFNSTSNKYPHCIILTDHATTKTRNTWKNVMMTSSSRFSGISCFWGIGVCQKYAVWVLFRCGIKFRIQRALPLGILLKSYFIFNKWEKWRKTEIKREKAHAFGDSCQFAFSKNRGRYVENTNKKIVFFYDKYVNSTIMVESFYWNSIGSWIPTHKIYC